MFIVCVVFFCLYRNKEDVRCCDIDCVLCSCVVFGWDILLYGRELR